ncbi:OmpA family protein [Nonomuraea dietziae]|uniref:OmpA family protein n=1 Tax=Nonomuraea dietziae TaxID=65515 RepID=UPI0033F81799
MTFAAFVILVAGCSPTSFLPVAQQSQAPPPSAPSSVTPSSAAPSSSSPSPGPSAGGDDRPALAAAVHGVDKTRLKVEPVAVNRVAGKHLVVQLRLSNAGTEEDISWTGPMGDSTRPLGQIRWASGIGVLDGAAHRLLLPYKPADGVCLCSDQDRDDLPYSLEPGESITVYGVLPAPSGEPETVTIVTPETAPMFDVPVSDEPPVPAPGMALPDPEAQQVSTLSHPVQVPSESLDKSEETADDGKDLRVSLSSDVLFAVNKATLTPKARSVLARTAKLVDASTGPAVTVEGHADSSGTDAINDPLSRRRAQAVQRALSSLVTRDGIAFEARGYGSRRPLYDNASEEGRRRNRRVTVTFLKPEPAAPSPTTTSTAAPGAEGSKATSRAEGQPFGLEVTGLRSLPGQLAVLSYRVTNNGDQEAHYNELSRSSEWMSYKYRSASNVRLTDVAARREYLPGRIMVTTDDGTDAYCACSETAGVRLSAETFGPGQTREYWTLFALPSGAASLKLRVGDFPELRVAVN